MKLDIFLRHTWYSLAVHECATTLWSVSVLCIHKSLRFTVVGHLENQANDGSLCMQSFKTSKQGDINMNDTFSHYTLGHLLDYYTILCRPPVHWEATAPHPVPPKLLLSPVSTEPFKYFTTALTLMPGIFNVVPLLIVSEEDVCYHSFMHVHTWHWNVHYV